MTEHESTTPSPSYPPVPESELKRPSIDTTSVDFDVAELANLDQSTPDESEAMPLAGWTEISTTPNVAPSTPGIMNTLRRYRAAGAIILGAVTGVSLAGCATATATPDRTTVATATQTPEVKKTQNPQAEYQAAPTQEQIQAVYTPISARDEQLAQNTMHVVDLVLSGSAQKGTSYENGELTGNKGLSADAANQKMTADWQTPILSNANLFAQGEKTPGTSLISNILENNYVNDDGDGIALQTLAYDSYETIGVDSAQQRIINIRFKWVMDKSRNLSLQGPQPGQEGMWQITYVPSADGAHWTISKLADASYMLQN